MKIIKVFLCTVILFVMILPICIVLSKVSGIYLAAAIYSYLLILVFTVIVENKFLQWFESKLK